MRKLIATLLAVTILLGSFINVTLDLYGVKMMGGAAIAEEAASGGEPAAPAVAPKPSNPADCEKSGGDGGSSKQQASAPAVNNTEKPAEEKANEGSGEPVNSVEIVSETTVTSTNNFDTDVTENDAVDGTPSEESTVSSEEDEETEEPSEEPAGEAVAAPGFGLSGGLDGSWLKRWKEGKKSGVKIEYTVSTSAFVPEYSTLRIRAFGLKEQRSLRSGETEADLRHDVSGSGISYTFSEGNCSREGEYVLPEGYLSSMSSGSYEVYAVYENAMGEEKVAVFGGLSLSRGDQETDEQRAEPQVIVTGTHKSEGGADVMVLSATLQGFDGMEIETLQWQFMQDGNWIDVPGANGMEYRFVFNEATGGRQWRLKVTVAGRNDAIGAAAAEQ